MDACCRSTVAFQGEKHIAAAETIRVAHGAARALHPKRGTFLRCTVGVAWVTQAGVGEDVVVAAGQRYLVGRKGKVVIQPLTAAGAVVVVER